MNKRTLSARQLDRARSREMILGRRALLALGGAAAVSGLAACEQGGPAESSDADEDSAGHSEADKADAGSTDEGHTTGPVTPADARARLEEGNLRFAEGDATHPHQSEEDRTAVAGHQEPWALIHGCVDSRVSPEVVFDQGIGDIFTTRTAGTILDDTIVGSMEFAASDPYAVPLIVLLGHTACGAVTGTVDLVEASPDSPKAPGEINDIVSEIVPVVRSVERGDTDKEAYVDEVVRANVLSVRTNLLKRSAILRKAVKAGRTEVVSAVYNLETGLVTWLDDAGS